MTVRRWRRFRTVGHRGVKIGCEAVQHREVRRVRRVFLRTTLTLIVSATFVGCGSDARKTVDESKSDLFVVKGEVALGFGFYEVAGERPDLDTVSSLKGQRCLPEILGLGTYRFSEHLPDSELRVESGTKELVGQAQLGSAGVVMLAQAGGDLQQNRCSFTFSVEVSTARFYSFYVVGDEALTVSAMDLAANNNEVKIILSVLLALVATADGVGHGPRGSTSRSSRLVVVAMSYFG